MKAAAIILGPIIVGVLFFFVEARGQKSGVYLETPNGVFELPEYSTGTAPPFPVAVQHVPIPTDVRALSFFVVGPLSDQLAGHEQDAALYFFVVDRSDERFQSASRQIHITVRRVNPRVYHITSDDIDRWQRNGPASRHFRDVLALTTRSRGNMELLAGLVLPDPVHGLLRQYPVRFGP